VARMGEQRNVYRVLVGKPEGKIPIERTWRRWENGIKWTLGEIGWGGVEWIHLTQNRDCWRLLWVRWWTFGFWLHEVSLLVSLLVLALH
jgi:hypothetical protein